MELFGRIAFVKVTDYDTEVQYWGIVKVKNNKTISLDFYPYSILFYFGKKHV
jgi:hypothetical protein